MVLYSNEIKDFLDKIYFHELTHRNDLEFPLYNYYKDKLRNIDKMSRHSLSSTFPLSRDKLFGLIVGRLEFGYLFDGKNARIEYYINREPQNDWFDWLIKESKTTNNKPTITQKDLKNIINECVDRCLRKYLSKQTQKIPLNETHAVRTWHYTSFDQAISIIRQNKFKLRQNDDATDECKYKQKGVWYDGYGEMTTPPKYMLCTTRIRDSRVGFSSSFQYGFIQNGWGFCRIELDENAIEYTPSLIVRTERDCLQHKPHINAYNTKKWKFKDTNDWCTPNWENQHEERILAKVPVLDNAIQYIRRIDFLIKDKAELLTLKKVLKAKKNFAEKVFVYTNMSDFNSANNNHINLTVINESATPKNISYKIEGDNIIFIKQGDEIGGLCFNCSSFDDIYSEYCSSVEDFDTNIMRKFSYEKPIVNIEDIWVNRKYQGQGLFRQELLIGMQLLFQKYNQFILRACSDNGFPEVKLVQLYQDFGFTPYQGTDEDGTIMYLIK